MPATASLNYLLLSNAEGLRFRCEITFGIMDSGQPLTAIP